MDTMQNDLRAGIVGGRPGGRMMVCLDSWLTLGRLLFPCLAHGTNSHRQHWLCTLCTSETDTLARTPHG